MTLVYNLASKKGIDFIYESIKNQIKHKYSKYNSVEIYDGLVELKKLGEVREQTWLEDNKMTCLLSKEPKTNSYPRYSIFLIYTDKELYRQKNIEEENEF